MPASAPSRPVSRVICPSGLLVVVSAPSGAGKSTLCRLLVKRRKTLMFSVSVTTRPPRPGERDGRDYFFVSEAAFKAMRDRGDLVEWAEVHGQYYGTPKHYVDKQLAEGRDLLLDIDVQGALQVKRRFPNAVMIFITTPSFDDLEKRLRSRSSETEAQIQRRLADARRELRFVSKYQYLVINRQIPEAYRQLDAILTAESLRISTTHR
jgi:guanylate kinase